MIKRQTIIDAARTYLGTRFKHQGRIKGAGIDCVGLVLCVGIDVGLDLPRYLDYSRHPDGKTLQDRLETHMQRIPEADALPGDVLLFRGKSQPQHVGIISAPGYMVHAHLSYRKVVEHRIDATWRALIIRPYRYPGVE
jgi:NlpC/P60 family putative phage cell wall peptidase